MQIISIEDSLHEMSNPVSCVFFCFFFFLQKTGFDISCNLSSLKTICMKCQILFSGKNKKIIINLSSFEFSPESGRG